MSRVITNLIPKVDVPEGESGPWRVERFTVSGDDAAFSRLRAMLKGRGAVPVGDYTRLTRNGSCIMSDTPDEIRDHREPVRRASKLPGAGRVLIAGLGLGVVLNAVLLNTDHHVTVIERSGDVINLTWGHYAARYSSRLALVHADAMEWKPPRGERWDVAWYDIWDSICTDNLKQITKLKRRFARRVGWQGAWMEDLLRDRKRRDKSRGPW